jgi:flavin reductase (DIM6/NTAB) family NADH-FMN oxidoreductase RutF
MKNPNPQWRPGDTVEAPFTSMVTLDPAALGHGDIYRLMIATIAPRPIAFVTTMSARGEVNLAPFSFFNGVSSNPPCLMFSVARRPDGSKKDTLRNIEATGEFVVNSANAWLIEPLVHTAGEFPHGTDEMALVGLTAAPSTTVKPPRVKEAAVQFECSLEKTVEIGDGSAGSATIVVGRICLFHVAATAYQGGIIDTKRLEPVARLGGLEYALVGETFKLAVPKVKSGS